MSSYNKVVLMGNLTRDPETRFTESGTAVTEFGLAVNEKFKTKSGEIKETVMFIDITAWGKQAETIAEYLTKGSAVLVDGTLQLDQWETKEGGKRSKHRIRADFVRFMPSTGSKRPQPSDDDIPERDADNIPF